MENSVINQAVDKAVYEAVSQQLLIQGAVTSAIVIGAFIVLRFVLVHVIKGKTEILDKDQRRWINRINNGTSIAIVIGLVFIWAPQLQTFALSLTAVAVAIVLTTKELLMCLTGGFLRASSKPFDVGDWITVDGVMGEVMKISATTTLIEKIDTLKQSYAFTGETVQIPNSRFLSANVENANFIKSHIYHDVPITVQYADVDPARLMTELKKITEKAYAAFKEDAVKFNKRIERKAAVDFADPDPQFFLRTTDLGHNAFTVRIFLPTREALKTGTQITHDFLDYVHKQRLKTSKEANKAEV